VILVVAATPQEIAFAAGRPNVEVLVTGIGPVEAAAKTAHALARGEYGLVVNAGIAGALDPAIAIGDGVVVAVDRTNLDLETGDPLSLPQGLSVCDAAASDAHFVRALEAAGFRSVAGVTVCRVTATDATAQALRRTAQVESMEGFAVLRAAELAGVRAVELRGISNYAGERSRSQWNFSAGVLGLNAIAGAFFAQEPSRS
jgi:futalosine hydrolase